MGGFEILRGFFDGDKCLLKLGTDGAVGTHQSFNGEVVGAIEHGSNARVGYAHAFGELGAVDALLFHKPEQVLDNHELFILSLFLNAGGRGKGIGERDVAFNDGKDGCGYISKKSSSHIAIQALGLVFRHSTYHPLF